MTSLYDNIIFGPIRSRRLGLSLGVNLLPIESKLCSFDCIYCECGWNKDGISDRHFPRLEEVEQGVTAQLNTPLIIMDGFEISLQKLMDYNDEDIESMNILKDASATAIYGVRGANGAIVITCV